MVFQCRLSNMAAQIRPASELQFSVFLRTQWINNAKLPSMGLA